MKKPILVLLGIGLLGVIVCVALGVMPGVVSKRSAENVVFSDVGRYESPQGTQVVTVSREEGGTVQMAVTNSYGGGGSMKAIHANSAWFMCFDADDRLWVYLPDQNPRYCHCWYADKKGSGVRTAGELGGWQGIPEAFLARLPEPAKATYTMSQTAAELPTTR